MQDAELKAVMQHCLFSFSLYTSAQQLKTCFHHRDTVWSVWPNTRHLILWVPPPYLRPDVQTTLSEFRQRGQLLNKCPGLDRRRHKMDYINPRGRKKHLPLSRLLLSSCCRTLPSRKVFGKFSRSFLFIWFFPFCRISFLPPLFFLQILKDSIWKVVGRQ